MTKMAWTSKTQEKHVASRTQGDNGTKQHRGRCKITVARIAGGKRNQRVSRGRMIKLLPSRTQGEKGMNQRFADARLPCRKLNAGGKRNRLAHRRRLIYVAKQLRDKL